MPIQCAGMILNHVGAVRIQPIDKIDLTPHDPKQFPFSILLNVGAD